MKKNIELEKISEDIVKNFYLFTTGKLKEEDYQKISSELFSEKRRILSNE